MESRGCVVADDGADLAVLVGGGDAYPVAVRCCGLEGPVVGVGAVGVGIAMERDTTAMLAYAFCRCFCACMDFSCSPWTNLVIKALGAK